MIYFEYISGSHDTVEGEADRFDERYLYLSKEGEGEDTLQLLAQFGGNRGW